jgi:tRNA(Ile)-lysidine synthase
VLTRITVRFRRGGERVRPHGKQHHVTLKNLMQQWHIPPWQRDRVPLIYDGNEIIEVVGYCACD